MILTGLCRLGRDAEIRYTPEGKPVATMSAAWNFGRRDGEGKRPTQWIELTLWGDRAEALGEYLLKGTALVIVASGVHVETYERREGGTGHKLKASIDSIEFAGGRAEGGQAQAPAAAPAPAPASRSSAPAPARSKPPASGTGFDAMDDDIPF